MVKWQSYLYCSLDWLETFLFLWVTLKLMDFRSLSNKQSSTPKMVQFVSSIQRGPASFLLAFFVVGGTGYSDLFLIWRGYLHLSHPIGSQNFTVVAEICFFLGLSLSFGICDLLRQLEYFSFLFTRSPWLTTISVVFSGVVK